MATLSRLLARPATRGLDDRKTPVAEGNSLKKVRLSGRSAGRVPDCNYRNQITIIGWRQQPDCDQIAIMATLSRVLARHATRGLHDRRKAIRFKKYDYQGALRVVYKAAGELQLSQNQIAAPRAPA